MRSEWHRLLKFVLGLEKLYLNKDKAQPPQTFVFQIIVTGENYMGDKIAVTGNQDSIFNIKTDLNKVSQSINHFSETNSLFYELQNLNARLEEELGQGPGEREEEVEAVREYARVLMEEVTKAEPNKARIKISADGLLAAAKNIAAITPAVLIIATRIVEIITRYSS